MLSTVPGQLVNMCVQHNDMIEWFGYYEATKTTAFQDVYSVIQFLNKTGTSCTLHKDNRNMRILAISINGYKYQVKGKEAVYSHYGGEESRDEEAM